MKLTITINLDNAAFTETDGAREAEAARILQNYTDNLQTGACDLRPGVTSGLRDYNGNLVGEARVTK